MITLLVGRPVQQSHGDRRRFFKIGLLRQGCLKCALGNLVSGLVGKHAAAMAVRRRVRIPHFHLAAVVQSSLRRKEPDNRGLFFPGPQIPGREVE